MGYILAYLKALGYGGVILDDVYDRPLSLHALEMWIQKLDPALIGFSAYQDNMERIRFFSSYTKSHHNNIRILLGGPQAIFMPSAGLRQLEDVDIICRGEGEIVTAAIAECIEKNRPLSSVNAITLRDGNEIIDTELRRHLPEDLDQFPSPYLDDIINLEGKDTAMISTARGCKYNCLFCISPSVSGRKIRCHSVQRTLKEMECLVEKGITRFWFADENFGGSRERALEILQGKIDSGIKTRFWCQTRCDLVDEEMIGKLREAGADTIAFGLESANSGVLNNTGKGIALERLRRMIEVSRSAGLNVELFSMFGLPGETVEKARQTLHFVQTCKLPIRGNSRAQQMQLYFGSIYEKNHEKYGFKAIRGYLPSYLSIGDRYETQTLTRRDIRKIRAIWFLGLEEVARKVHNMERPFDLLDFLLTNEEDLHDEEAFYEYGAIVSSALEEQELLWGFLDGYVSRLNPGETRLNRLISKLNIFKETRQGAGSRSRVVFDSRSEMDGVSSLPMKDGYQDVMLGRNLLPPWFEMRLVGLRQRQRTTLRFRLPKESVPAELQNKTLDVWVEVHKVLNPVDVTSLKHLKSLNIRNHYVFPDLDRLSQQNDVLYYLALRDTPEADLVRMPVHFLMYMYYCARLHRMEYVKRAAALLANDKKALNALAETLYRAERYLEAAHYYGEPDSNDSDTLIKKARSLFLGGDVEEALNILNSMAEMGSLSSQELLLECLKALQPHSGQICLLDRHVLRLRAEAALEREIVDEANGSAIRPMVHGSA